MCDVVVKGSRSLSHLVMSSCYICMCCFYYQIRPRYSHPWCPASTCRIRYISLNVPQIILCLHIIVAALQTYTRAFVLKLWTTDKDCLASSIWSSNVVEIRFAISRLYRFQFAPVWLENAYTHALNASFGKI